MKLLLCALAGCLVVTILAAPLLAEDKAKSNKDKIVGVWKVTKLASGLPPGKTCEFTKDGKVELSADLELTLDFQGQEVKGTGKAKIAAGTYEIDGDKLKITLKGAGKDKKDLVHATTIVKLTDKVLETKDAKGNVNTFEKQ